MEIMEKGEVGKGFAKGVVALLHIKGGKETLLNVDYKLFTKVLAKRVKWVLEQVIGTEQTCAVQGSHTPIG